MKNIVFIGMMGSGKSIVGKKLSETLGTFFYDTDHIIESREGKTISEIFELFGESYFRKLEEDIVKEISNYENSVISTGGGIILNPVNIERLKKNSFIIYLENSIDELISHLNDETQNRPLLANENIYFKLNELFKQRENLYKKNADFIIENENMEDTIKKIINLDII